MGAIFLVSGFSIIFWIFWNLAYLPVYYYWTEHMNWVVAGYEVPTTWFDASNSFWCVVLGPIMASLWVKLSARPQGDMSLFRKTGIGIAVIGVSYVFFAVLDVMRRRKTQRIMVVPFRIHLNIRRDVLLASWTCVY